MDNNVDRRTDSIPPDPQRPTAGMWPAVIVAAVLVFALSPDSAQADALATLAAAVAVVILHLR